MKAVLISIQPKWCELIANGKKTVEVRKTKPKLETPFKCYIYCTQGDSLNYLKRFSHSKFNKFWIDNKAYGCNVARGNGKVIGEFVCRGIMQPYNSLYRMARESCLTEQELIDYSNGKMLYGWRIADLVIYDKPKELSEFKKQCNGVCVDTKSKKKCQRILVDGFSCNGLQPITRPPQSWCYVEEDCRDCRYFVGCECFDGKTCDQFKR